jgi:hypothetical protein
MVDAQRFRVLIVARAGGACEYCRLVEIATGMTFSSLDYETLSAQTVEIKRMLTVLVQKLTAER